MAAQEDVLIADRYRLVSRIGDGGMSTVWEAWDERLHRRIALKRLRPQPGLPENEAHLAAERTMREARITARLHHAHAVQVYDVVYDGEAPCLIMQYVPSRSLQTVLAERKLDVAEVARIGSEVASALAVAHDVGIVHRDVKPGNILVDDHGSAKITDFGISHALGDVTLTSTGLVTGTPAYLAPEVARGEPAGHPADVFSLGATLYTAIEGSPPVGNSDNPIAVLHRVANGKLNPPSRNTPLAPVLERMLALDPAARPAMDEVRDRLADIARGVHATTVPAPVVLPPEPAPPSTTVMLPPAREKPAAPPVPPVPPVPPQTRRRHNRGPLVALAVLAALLLLGGVVVLLVTLGDDSGQDLGSGTQSSTPPSSPHTTAQSSTQSSTQSTHHTQAGGAQPPPSSTTSSSSSSDTSSSSSSSSSSETGGGDGSATQLAAAIDDYYSVLPDDTDTAWSRLTPGYQQGHAGGRDGFDNFWSQFSSVTTSDTHATGDSTVESTITYTFEDGHTSREVTDFGLVDDGGTLKIASSDVVG